MSNPAYYIWLILLIIYIISPLDFAPAFFDDLIALGALVYMILKQKKLFGLGTASQSRSQAGNQSYQQNAFSSDISLDEAYKTLGVSSDAPWEEVKKAYKEKIIKCHPDKVNHLSEELQEKARELTLTLNAVLEIIKKNRKV